MIECMIIDLTLDLLKEKATKKKATRASWNLDVLWDQKVEGKDRWYQIRCMYCHASKAVGALWPCEKVNTNKKIRAKFLSN